MSACNFCGKIELQEYTFDDIFTCADCNENTDGRTIINTNREDAPVNVSIEMIETIQDNTINSNNNSYSNILQNNTLMNTLITQVDFLKSQIQEKDFFIRQLLALLKDNTENHGFVNSFKASTPVIKNSIVTPSRLSMNRSSVTEESKNDESSAQFITLDEKISCSSNEMNTTYIVKDELGSPTTNVENINNQLKNVRLEHHQNYIKSKSIYSDISNTSLESTFETVTKKSPTFIDKATIDQRKKIKAALEKITKKEYHARYRTQDQPFPWQKSTTLIVGDSILQGINEQKLERYNTKVRSFPGSTIDDLYDYCKPLLKKKPANIIIHCGTNDAHKKTAGEIINELKNLKIHIEENSPGSNVYFSSPILRDDNVNLNKKLQEVSLYLEQNFKLLVTSRNIDRTCLGKRGLHLNPKGSGRFASNLITLMKCL